ncbi:hypothetical protein H9L39_10344 [Fusarium oxysporum f. sp. albedinis]|nr:hypothetical protein H9L39_10344 [Fusarium oxysporum f. sp. albedinis]
MQCSCDGLIERPSAWGDPEGVAVVERGLSGRRGPLADDTKSKGRCCLSSWVELACSIESLGRGVDLTAIASATGYGSSYGSSYSYRLC